MTVNASGPLLILVLFTFSNIGFDFFKTVLYCVNWCCVDSTSIECTGEGLISPKPFPFQTCLTFTYQKDIFKVKMNTAFESMVIHMSYWAQMKDNW